MTLPTTEQQRAEWRRIDKVIAAIRAKLIRKARRRKFWRWLTGRSQ
jgi:hypothetical protein